MPAVPAAGDNEFVALATSPNSTWVGWGAWGTAEEAKQIALAQCGAKAVDACEVVAANHNGCAPVAENNEKWRGAYGPDADAASAGERARPCWSTRRPNRRGAVIVMN